MAKAKFERLNPQNSDSITHANLQAKRTPGSPKGKRKIESAEEKISISLTKTQKEELTLYSEQEHRSISSVIKLTLFKAGIISKV